jgi:hypothetical protein
MISPLRRVMFLVLTCAPTLLIAASALEDPLWRKAVGIANSNSNSVPGLTVTRTEVLHKGDPASVHEVWQRSALGTNGQVVRRTVKVLEDGKDVTKSIKAKPAKSDGGIAAGIPRMSGSHPFDPTVQDQVSLHPTVEARVILGKQCVAYDFDLRRTNGTLVKGKTWIEKTTGWPAEIENMTFTPQLDKRFKRLAITTRYESGPENRWQIKEVVMTGTVSVLFIKADVRSTTTFSEYWNKHSSTNQVPSETR